jgi:hypothetical protein
MGKVWIVSDSKMGGEGGFKTLSTQRKKLRFCEGATQRLRHSRGRQKKIPERPSKDNEDKLHGTYF